MQTEFTSSYCNLDELSLFSGSDAFPSDPFPPLTSELSTDNSLSNTLDQNMSIHKSSRGLSELFIEHFEDEKPAHATNEFNWPTLSDQEKQSESQTNVESQQESPESTETQVKKALHEGNELNFAYLMSEKVYDPKRLPIEDKGRTYYYQDDPALYRKIKK